MKKISKLQQNEVFVFGANSEGFHGAGAAATAFGVVGNWFESGDFLRAKKELKRKQCGLQYNAQMLVGKWCILGEVGLMKGLEGRSYGIVTTEKPGIQGKVNLSFLKNEVAKLFECANSNPKLQFLCTSFGLKRPRGFSWFEPIEIRQIWEECGICPPNIKKPSYL